MYRFFADSVSNISDSSSIINNSSWVISLGITLGSWALIIGCCYCLCNLKCCNERPIDRGETDPLIDSPVYFGSVL